MHRHAEPAIRGLTKAAAIEHMLAMAEQKLTGQYNTKLPTVAVDAQMTFLSYGRFRILSNELTTNQRFLTKNASGIVIPYPTLLLPRLWKLRTRTLFQQETARALHRHLALLRVFATPHPMHGCVPRQGPGNRMASH